MVEPDVLSNTFLQVSPKPCESCIVLGKNGQNQVANGSFFTHLNNSLKQQVDLNSGKKLPVTGNNMPETIFSYSDLTNSLEPVLLLDKNFSELEISDIAKNENLIKLSNFEDIQEQIKFLSLNKENNTNSVNISNELLITTGIPNNGLVDDQNASLITSSQSSVNVSDKLVSGDSALKAQQSKLFFQQQKPDGFIQIDTSANGKQEEAIHSFLNKQYVNTNIINSENDDGFVKQYNFEQLVDNISKIDFRNLKQQVDIESNPQISTATKADSVLQNQNPIISYEASGRINHNFTQNYIMDSPIPLNIKQSINSNGSFEQSMQSADQSLFQNIKWLISNKVQHAKINVYPEKLGHVNVSLNLDDSKLTVNFLTNSAVTKEVIEANLLSLRNQLTENGINLHEVNVSNRFASFSEHQSQDSESGHLRPDNHYSNSSPIHQEDKDAHSDDQVKIISPMYLIDAYA